MANIYVAGKDIERAKRVMCALQEAGHTITYDWATDYSDENPDEKAAAERESVQVADILVYLWESGQESARYEAGMAMGLSKPIIASGNMDAFFFLLPEVHCVQSDEQIVEAIATGV